MKVRLKSNGQIIDPPERVANRYIRLGRAVIYNEPAKEVKELKEAKVIKADQIVKVAKVKEAKQITKAKETVESKAVKR